jgi:hypothetical protein
MPLERYLAKLVLVDHLFEYEKKQIDKEVQKIRRKCLITGIRNHNNQRENQLTIHLKILI